ncbi:MAG: DUF4956 domain-containing protein [Bryobacteraceae bacterium]
MGNFLSEAFGQSGSAQPLEVLARLIAAVALGAAVSWIYTRTTRTPTPALTATLVLLAVLIAMVTQVVGDNVARAFSLVGALSIVRFRTVVRDTRDTAFVIFSVVLGMAAGAQNIAVALLGLGVAGGAAFLMAARDSGIAADPPFRLTVRSAIGLDVDKLVEGRFRKRQLLGVSTAKQGTALETIYGVWLQPGTAAQEVVKDLNKIEGIIEISLNGQGPTDERS